MERVLVSRQPIYSAGMAVLGYELLFRGDAVNYASFSDADRATAEVILNTFMGIGLQDVVGRNLAFINFTRNLLMGDYCESLPRQRVVLELMESVEPDDALLNRLAYLKSAGYRIALTHFPCADPFYPLLEFVRFVKIDIASCDEQMIQRSVRVLKKFPIQLIAEKVETLSQFQFCQALGFDYFQGYFLCRPELMASEQLPAHKLTTVRLITKLNDPNISMRELEEVLGQNLSLTYKLLRYTNSVVCGLRRSIESIRHAAIIVGLERLRIWASLVLLYGIEDKPQDVIVTGTIRARMCEKLAEALKISDPERFFLVGLFSVLDVLFNRRLDEMLDGLPLAQNIVDALLRHEGQLGSVLRCVLAYEQRNWFLARNCVHLNLDTIAGIYEEAVEWSVRNLNALSEQEKRPRAAERYGMMITHGQTSANDKKFAT